MVTVVQDKMCQGSGPPAFAFARGLYTSSNNDSHLPALID